MPAPEIVYAKINQALQGKDGMLYRVIAGMPYPGNHEIVTRNPEAFSDRPVGPLWDAQRIEAAVRQEQRVEAGTRAPGEVRGRSQ